MLNKIFLLHHSDQTYKKRYDYVSKRLREENIDFELIDGFAPDEIDYDEIVKNYSDFESVLIEQIKHHSYYNFSKKISPASLSLVLKHLHCWKKQIENNYEYCLIIEDDCEIPFSFGEKLHLIMEEVKNVGCDLVMIGTAFDLISPSIFEDKKNIYYHSLQKTRCTHAYIIKKDCANKMICGFSNINLPIDFKMNEVIQLESIKVYWYEPGLKQKDFT